MNYLFNNLNEILNLTITHLFVTFASTIPAIFLGILLGILFSRKKFINIGKFFMVIFGILQSIPSVAFIAIIFVYTGIGLKTALIALFFYSIVPIIYNTTSSLIMVPDEIVEAAKGMGLSKSQIIFKVELPYSLRGVISGIRTSLTINVATATVATVIGVDTLGKIILIGLRVRKLDMLWVGGVFVAILAILIDTIFEKFENIFVKWA